MFSIALPVIGILSLITAVRFGWTLIDIASAEKPRDLSGPVFKQQEGNGTDPSEDPEDNLHKTDGDIVIQGLFPRIMKKNSSLYAVVEDFSIFSEEAETTSLTEIWESPGFQKASAPIADLIQKRWKTFQSTYRFPLERIFKGLGPYAARTEFIITDFALFRGTYTIRLAASCTIKKDTGSFRAAFMKNGGSGLNQVKIRGVSVLQKQAPSGTFSVFFQEKRMFVTAGKGMCEYLINQIQNLERIKGERFADNDDFRKAYSSLRANRGVFMFISGGIIREITQQPGAFLKGPIGIRCTVQQGEVHERIFIESGQSGADYFKHSEIRDNISIPENTIAYIQAGLTRAAIEKIAELSFRIYGTRKKIVLNRNRRFFWEYLLNASDISEKPSTGILKWTSSGPFPSWYFITDISDNTKLEEWIKALAQKHKTTTIKRADNIPVEIVQLDKDAMFGSFCYFKTDSSLYCSYSSQLLKNAVIGSVARKPENSMDQFKCGFDAGEASAFIEAKKYQGLFKMIKWIDIEQIPDLSTTGSLIGTVTFTGRKQGPYLLINARSETGCTGIVPFTLYFQNICNLREE